LIIICSLPLFLLTIKNWGNGVLIIGGTFCLINLLQNKEFNFANTTNPAYATAFIGSWTSLLIATIAAAIIRWSIDWQLLDSPLRFIFAIPVFVFVTKQKADAMKILLRFCIAAILITLIYQVFSSQTEHWDTAGRMSTHFADPLTFGYFCLSLALAILAALITRRNKKSIEILVKATIIGCGLYMSISSQSRTGWGAVPILTLLFLYIYRARLTRRYLITFVSAAIIICIGFWLTSSTIRDRSMQTIEQIHEYHLDGIAPDTSIGLRVTFLRIAVDLISARPFQGYGDTQKRQIDLPSEIHNYATRNAIEFALSSGFHNEIMTNAVQSGLFAALATAFVFFTPIFIYWKTIANGDATQKTAAFAGMAFTITIFVSSFSTEVFGLKYTASFYAMMNAILCGSCLKRNERLL
ncbi:MAG: O-antigen ligase family protein, partial [Microcystis aeruginosa Ma_MB_F_20061100_S20]